MVATVWMCPGQGSQYVGMGVDLAEGYPVAAATFAAIDEALKAPLSDLMWSGPESELTQTHNTQAAILAHTAAVLAILREHEVPDPAVAIGHSVGEYGALVAAGGLVPEAAARVVRKRGELMLEAGKARRGTMAAVIGLPNDTVREVCAEVSSEASVVVAANLNAPGQTVISGDFDAVERAAAACRERGSKGVLPLKVSGAFHSPLMDPALDPFAAFLQTIEFKQLRFPVIANATAVLNRTGARARALLVEQLVSPVRWVECMQEAARVAGDAPRFVEIGPGRVLSGIAKRMVQGADIAQLGTAEQVRTFLDTACAST